MCERDEVTSGQAPTEWDAELQWEGAVEGAYEDASNAYFDQEEAAKKSIEAAKSVWKAAETEWKAAELILRGPPDTGPRAGKSVAELREIFRATKGFRDTEAIEFVRRRGLSPEASAKAREEAVQADLNMKAAREAWIQAAAVEENVAAAALDVATSEWKATRKAWEVKWMVKEAAFLKYEELKKGKA